MPPGEHRRGKASRIAVAIILAAAAGCEKPLVQVVPVRTGFVESTATSVESGVVKARRDSILSVPVSGRIVEVLKKKGDRIREGETVIRLENDLEKIALDEAQVEHERLKTLGPTGGASQELLDRARFAVERARVHYERTFVRAPFSGLLIELNANLGEMSYGTMPLDMVLGGRKGNAEETLARVIDDSVLFIEADIDEADAGRLRTGQVTRITIEALGGKAIEGKLLRTSPAVSTIEGRSRTVRVEIGLDPAALKPLGIGGEELPGPALLVGMSADIEVVLDRKEGAVYVPTLVILEGQEGKSAYAVEGGRLRRRAVRTGLSNWERTEILEGLRAGEIAAVPTDRKKLIEGLAVRTELREEAAARP